MRTGKGVKPAFKALIEREGKILVLKTETENSVYWVLPGGKVEYGEKPMETLEREIEEELSAEVEIGNPVECITSLSEKMTMATKSF